MSGRASQSGHSRKSRNTTGKPSMCSSELESRVEAVRIQLEEERKRRVEVEQQIQTLVYQKGGPQAAAVAKILKEGDLPDSGNSNKYGSSSRGSIRSVRSNSSQLSSSQQFLQQQHTPSSYGRQQLPPITSEGVENASTQLPPKSNQSTQFNTASIPNPPSVYSSSNRNRQNQQQKRRKSSSPPMPLPSSDADIVSKCEKEASDCEKLLRQLNNAHAVVLSRKPPLPQQARGISRKSGPNGQQVVSQTGAAGCDYVMARRSKATPAQLYMMSQWHQERMDKINAFTYGIAGGSY